MSFFYFCFPSGACVKVQYTIKMPEKPKLEDIGSKTSNFGFSGF